MRLLLVLAAALLTACSPLYVLRSAKGHAGLLWRRKSIEKALKDPRTPPALREKLALVQEVRRHGREAMGLSDSKDYTTYSPVSGSYLTWLVTGSARTKLEAYVWRFPLAGSYPYKGHFREADARAEEAELESRGYDAYVRGVTAYNTPLWVSDPLPTTALQGEAGDLAELLLHELAHGTVYFKGQTEFDEGLASFVGERGAEGFLEKKYGPGSPEAQAYAAGFERQKRYDAELAGLRARLSELYASPASEAEKLERRKLEFEAAKESLAAAGFKVAKLNNAFVVAHGVYRERTDAFARAFEKSGRDWPKFFALMRSLDKKAPMAALEDFLRGS